MCDALHYLLDNVFIRFGSKLYRQVVGFPMGTNCAPLVADLFLLCYKRDFMLSLSGNKKDIGQRSLLSWYVHKEGKWNQTQT